MCVCICELIFRNVMTYLNVIQILRDLLILYITSLFLTVKAFIVIVVKHSIAFCLVVQML